LNWPTTRRVSRTRPTTARRGDPSGDRRIRPTARRVRALGSAISSSVRPPNPSEPGAGRVFSCPLARDGHPGPWIDAIRSAGTARGNKPPATAAATDGRTGTMQPVSMNSCSASARATASSTRCKRAALHGLCWFDSNPMHQSMVSVVQSVRTPDCDSGGRGFESRPSPQVPSPARFRDPRSSLAGGLPGRRGSRSITRS
jgi:hypothetical protein